MLKIELEEEKDILHKKMSNNKREEIYKMNAIGLAKHHRKYCEGKSCSISLFILKEMAENSGVEFTDRELEEFV